MMEQKCLPKGQFSGRAEDLLAPVVSTSSSSATSVPTETLTSLLKPALVNSANARVNSQQMGRSNSCKTPSPTSRKPMKQIRFDLGNGNTSKDDSWLSPTPPPKDFKRMGTQRRTMLPPRSERCVSTAITQKELQAAFLFGNIFLHLYIQLSLEILLCLELYYNVKSMSIFLFRR